MRWMLVFTIEMDIEPEIIEGFGDVAEEIIGQKVSKQIVESTKNRTVKHVMSIPKNEHWSDKKRADILIQWDSDVERVVL